jgi:energy-coupling factor transporter ATP-binding protein EcfA2
MYVRIVEAENIRALPKLQWDLERRPSEGWHVVLGANGSGKSTLLRSIALALVGPTEAVALRQRWDDWLRRGQARGHVAVHVQPDPDFDRTIGGGRKITKYLVPAAIVLHRTNGDVTLDKFSHKVDPSRHVWGGGRGWFSVGYGALRRFAGSDKDTEKLYYSNPLLARHLTLFGESVALSECLAWLQRLQFESLDAEKRGDPSGGPSGELLQKIRVFVNQDGFLFFNAKLSEITPREVTFVDGGGFRVAVEELSDGYRSILSLTFELIRQLVLCYGADVVFDPNEPTKIAVPGVVLIDEVDAHLHPSWQRRIGLFLTEHFPRMQFIVATHSPLVCQAAVKGSVYRLARPGTEEESAFVQGSELDRLLYGNVLDAFGTESFGIDAGGRSALSRQKLARLAELNQKMIEEGLSNQEKSELWALRRELPTAASVIRQIGGTSS